MAVGFGFSVSDICNAFKLLKTSVRALDERHGAAKEFAGLLSETELLQQGMHDIEELLLDEDLPYNQHRALEDAVDACQRTIDNFIEDIAKYQPHLTGVKSQSVSTRFRKLTWALCRKDDVDRFRAQVERHVSSINMLLLTLQTKRAQPSQSVIRQDDVVPANKDLTAMMQNMTIEQRQCLSLLLQQNQELLRSVQDLRNVLNVQRMIPPQVLLQQPVILLDPLGQFVPFHLEFIDSLDCFVAVLRSRFAKAGISSHGLVKLTEREFTIEDSNQKRTLRVSGDWLSAFHPGQQINMRMRYHRFACKQNTCPNCLQESEDEEDDAQCPNCGLAYQQFCGISKQSPDWREWGLRGVAQRDLKVQGEEIPYILLHPREHPELQTFDPPEEPEDRSLDGYRRVQVISQHSELLDPLFPGLRLIEDFVHFAKLLEDVPTHVNPYLLDIFDVQQEAREYLIERDARPVAFSSFAQMIEVRQALTDDSRPVRQKIDNIIQSLCNDPETPNLVNIIKHSEFWSLWTQGLSFLTEAESPIVGRSSYYAGVLSVMTSLSGTQQAKSPDKRKTLSKEKMQWRLLDSGGSRRR